MLELEVYDQQNITFEAAYTAALVSTDAFRSDFIRVEYRPQWLQCGSLPLASYTTLLNATPFRVTVECQARRMYMNVRRNPRCLLYLARDSAKKSNLPPWLAARMPGGQNSKYVSVGSFVLPAYHPSPPHQQHTNPFLYKVETLLLGWWYWLRDIWDLRSFKDALSPPEMLAEFQRGGERCHAVETPERMAELRSMSSEQLRDTVIPKPLAYTMDCFVVASDEQGRGYARRAMDLFLARLKASVAILPPPQLPNCPPKFEFFASPIGLPFYVKYGFKIGAQWENAQPSGSILNHTIFYMNL